MKILKLKKKKIQFQVGKSSVIAVGALSLKISLFHPSGLPVTLIKTTELSERPKGVDHQKLPVFMW